MAETVVAEMVASVVVVTVFEVVGDIVVAATEYSEETVIEFVGEISAVEMLEVIRKFEKVVEEAESNTTAGFELVLIETTVAAVEVVREIEVAAVEVVREIEVAAAESAEAAIVEFVGEIGTVRMLEVVEETEEAVRKAVLKIAVVSAGFEIAKEIVVAAAESAEATVVEFEKIGAVRMLEVVEEAVEDVFKSSVATARFELFAVFEVVRGKLVVAAAKMKAELLEYVDETGAMILEVMSGTAAEEVAAKAISEAGFKAEVVAETSEKKLESVVAAFKVVKEVVAAAAGFVAEVLEFGEVDILEVVVEEAGSEGVWEAFDAVGETEEVSDVVKGESEEFADGIVLATEVFEVVGKSDETVVTAAVLGATVVGVAVVESSRQAPSTRPLTGGE